MKRPVGVTASAIVAVLGSIVALLVAVFSVVALFVEPPPSQPPNSVQSIIASAVMLTVLAGLGIWTAIGLLRLRRSARTSILIFAGFLAGFCAFGLVIMLNVPIPPEISAGTQNQFRQMVVTVLGIPLAVAIWWLIQFNTASTKAAFAESIGEPPSARPISITVIAWASIFGGSWGLAPLFARTPAFLFGVVLHGWAASIFYAFFAALELYIGKGLLELREEARVLAIGWSAFALVHAGAVTLVPPLRERMLELGRTLDQNPPTAAAVDMQLLTNVMLVSTTILSLVTIWFLVRNRAAFVHTFAD